MVEEKKEGHACGKSVKRKCERKNVLAFSCVVFLFHCVLVSRLSVTLVHAACMPIHAALLRRRLVCSATYIRHDGEKKYFRKFFKFNVESPFAIKAKSHTVQVRSFGVLCCVTLWCVACVLFIFMFACMCVYMCVCTYMYVMYVWCACVGACIYVSPIRCSRPTMSVWPTLSCLADHCVPCVHCACGSPPITEIHLSGGTSTKPCQRTALHRGYLAETSLSPRLHRSEHKHLLRLQP
jgi:Protein of unknown function (DUF974)